MYQFHQIRRLFMVEDKPKTKDHDFPMAHKIIPCGKVILLNRGKTLRDIFGGEIDPETQTEVDNDLYEYDNV